MKKFIITLFVILFAISLTFNVINIIDNNTTSSTATNEVETYFENIDNKIKNEPLIHDEWIQDELNLYKDLSLENLAVLISNKDYTVSFLDQIAINHGFNGYTDLCCQLIDNNYLVFIPSYEHPEWGHMEANICTPQTVGYEEAILNGVIEEVK